MRALRSFFDRNLAYIIIALLVATTALILFVGLQGIRVRRVAFDTTAATRFIDQTMVVSFNQILPHVRSSDVSISPRTDMSVQSVRGSVLRVRFNRALHYDTAYTLSVNINGQSVEHHFRTPPLRTLHLAKSGTGDALLASTPTQPRGKAKLVFSASDIVQYAIAGNDVFANAYGDDLASTLTKISLTSGARQTIKLPFRGAISQLRASPDGSMIGFGLMPRSDKGVNGLFLYNVGAGTMREVTNKGAHIDVYSWRFASDNRTLLVKDTDAHVSVVDSRDIRPAKYLGEYGNVYGIAADQKTALLGALGITQGFSVQFADGAKRAYPAKPLAANELLSGIYPFRNSDASLLYVQQLVGDTDSEDRLFYNQGTTRKQIYQSDKTMAINAVSISPDDQYAAIELNDVSDADESTNTQTVLLNIATGETLAVVSGSQLTW